MAGVLAAAGCSGQGRDREEATAGTPIPDHVIEGFVLVETVSGERRWVLAAERAISYEDANEIYTFDVTIDFYDEEGEHYSRLTAARGTYDSITSDMEAIGEVVVTSDRGAVLETERLRWSNSEARITSNGPVRITKDDAVLTGRGFESDPSLEHISIKEDFRAVTRVSPDGE
ncbi:hypothetical protein AMJ39_02380 [candidate division TA06 bacterium DG_24]|nr:MAG: hypothetical protein AMJ39_02380 [candidate division TA06 bacterium DG_24]KPL10099.1 MAG: hypothetical protein AMJ71_04390 [candidate division TA06 bacterium SM1_40]